MALDDARTPGDFLTVYWATAMALAKTGGVIGPQYAASKAGILGLTHSYAALLAKEGITVNVIAAALIPVGRFGTVDEVTDTVVMLATNGYITGQTINVNGGWYMS